MRLISLLPAAAAVAMTAAVALADNPSRLIILHTNDTHSQIDPDTKDLGGIARRKVLVDSVRSAEPATLLVDAGDAVQGTLFFNIFRGEVEDTLMNLLGYDIQILGNHEFDNGIAELAGRWKRLHADRVTTNYDLRAVPALDSIFTPYVIKSYGDKRVGIIGINLDPAGMIAPANCRGIVYLDPTEAANSTAWHLRHNERCDYVIAVTHIGYSGKQRANDLDLGRRSRNIDVIIGGHSHTEIDPSKPDSPLHRVANADGDTVVIAQNGKGGATLGEIDIDLATGAVTSRLIPVDSRLDARTDSAVETILRPYRNAVDSLTSIRIGRSPAELPHRSTAQVNLISDVVADEGSDLIGRRVDLAFMNKGGIRCAMPKGDITRGFVMQMLPFDNRVVVMEISGRDLIDAFDSMAARGGDGISSSARAVIDTATGKCSSITIDGEPIDPSATYTLATIDYLANGGDYMTPLTRGRIIATDPRVAYDTTIDWFKSHRKFRPDNTVRMTQQ